MNHFLYTFLPHLCPLCRMRSRTYLCEGCQRDLPRAQPCCDMCALPVTLGQILCGDCLTSPKPYARSVCPLLYRNPVDHLMAQFKDHQPRTLGRALLPFLLDSLHNIYGGSRPWPELLVPVPSHWRTRLKRGFNQAHALADMLGDAVHVPVKPLVKRQGGVRAQKTLDRKTRFANLRDAFACGEQLRGECIAVVDDVITTGATAELISDCLLKAGAGEVHIWALARTPKPGG